MLSRARIEPLPREAWGDEMKAALEARGVPAEGPVFNIFTTLWRHPALAKAWTVFGGYTQNQSTAPARAREVVILRVAVLVGCDYEWSHHRRIAERVGLTAAEIAAIANPGANTGMSGELQPRDALLVKAVDELVADHVIGDDTWSRMAAAFDERQLMDLVFTAGSYLALALALNSFGVQLDEAAPA